MKRAYSRVLGHRPQIKVLDSTSLEGSGSKKARPERGAKKKGFSYVDGTARAIALGGLVGLPTQNSGAACGTKLFHNLCLLVSEISKSQKKKTRRKEKRQRGRERKR